MAKQGVVVLCVSKAARRLHGLLVLVLDNQRELRLHVVQFAVKFAQCRGANVARL